MPLTVELYGSSESKGHLIIDRNNLIFVYPKGSSIEENKSIRDKIITPIRLTINLNEELNAFKMESTTGNACDPLHDALEHSSTYGMECAHLHFLFQEDVNWELLALILEHQGMCLIDKIISPECRRDILNIALNYFDDLQVSPAAQKDEQQYRQAKDMELQDATSATSVRKSTSNSTVNDLRLNQWLLSYCNDLLKSTNEKTPLQSYFLLGSNRQNGDFDIKEEKEMSPRIYI